MITVRSNITRKYFAAAAVMLLFCIFSVAAGRCAVSEQAAAYHAVFPPTLLQTEYGKVNSNSVSRIELYATYHDKSLFARDVTIKVYDKTSDTPYLVIHPETDAGYSPHIQLCDFTGDGLSEIFLTMDSGGSGAFGFYYVYRISDGAAEVLFDFDTLPNPFSAHFSDGYKLIVTSGDSSYVLDAASARSRQYIDKLYLPDGTLRQPVTADVSAVNTVYPIFQNSRGRCDLLVMRRIIGLYNADSYGYAMQYFTFDTGKSAFAPYFEMVAVAAANPSLVLLRA